MVYTRIDIGRGTRTGDKVGSAERFAEPYGDIIDHSIALPVFCKVKMEAIEYSSFCDSCERNALLLSNYSK